MANESSSSVNFGVALKSGLFWAVVSALILLPFIGILTVQNLRNQLVLESRWTLYAQIVAIIAVAAFAISVRAQRKANAPAKAKATLSRLPISLGAVRVVALIAMAVYPVLVVYFLGERGSIKWIDSYGVQILTYVMLGWGLNIVVGLAGLLDLGYVAFYAVGAYSYAILSKTYGLSFWELLPISGFLAALWGIILGFPVLRLRGDYLAIVTLAFGEIIRLVLINWVDFSGGYAGISSIPEATLFGMPFSGGGPGSAEDFLGLSSSSVWYKTFLYYLIFALALLTAFVATRLRRLPIGRAWEALREDEIACRSLGINTTNTKLTAFALGAMFAGFAGAFFAARIGFISPESFTFNESVQVLAIVVLGGMGSLEGVVIAAVAIVGGFELLRQLEFLKHVFGKDFDPSLYRSLIFGAAMVGMMLWKPRGLISHRDPSAFLKEKKSVSGSLVKEGHG